MIKNNTLEICVKKTDFQMYLLQSAPGLAVFGKCKYLAFGLKFTV